VYELKGATNNFEKLIKLFNLSITETAELDPNRFKIKKSKAGSENDYSSFLDLVNLNTLSTKSNTSISNSVVSRVFKYDKLLKTNFSSSVILISGNLPGNIEYLVSKYIASIPASSIKALKKAKDKRVFTNKVTVKEFEWKRPISIINYQFSKPQKKKLTFKDELILEAISQYSDIKMFGILREKYGLVYSTGTTAITKKKPYDFQSLSIRYMVDPLNTDKSRLIFEKEILKPLSNGEISDKEVEHLKAMLVSTYLTSFYDDGQINDNWLKSNLMYNKILSPVFIKETIESISVKSIKNMMTEILNNKGYFVLIRAPKPTS